MYQAFFLFAKNMRPSTPAAGRRPRAAIIRAHSNVSGANHDCSGLRNLALLAVAFCGGLLLAGCGAAQFSDLPAAQLTVNATSVGFGVVDMNSPATQVVKVSSTGGAPLTITDVTVSGTGFTVSGVSLPLTLDPGTSTALNVKFTPVAAGSVTGELTITSNSKAHGKTKIKLNGTGGQPTTGVHQVALIWNSPVDTSDPVTSYNIYRAMSSGPFQRLSAVKAPTTQYVDINVQSGTTYNYQVTSVDAAGIESTPSNMSSASIP